MRKETKLGVGDTAKVEIEFDPEPRIVPMNYPLERALEKNKKAKIAFKKLTSSHKKEILVYLNYLKTEEAIKRSLRKVNQLVGKKHK